MRFKNNNAASLSRRLVAYSVAAGAVAVGAASPAQGALQVFDYRAAPLNTNVEDNYSVWDHDLAVLYMDGTYKRSTHDGATYTFYDQNGVTTPIDAGDKTDDSIWFIHHDFMATGSLGTKGYDGLFIYPGAGGIAAHPYDGNEGGNPLYEVEHAHTDNAVVDYGLEGTETEVHGGLSFTPDNAGAVMFGQGGYSGSPGWGGYVLWGDHKGFVGQGFVGFYLDEIDGRHYGWVEVSFAYRPYGMTIYGWGYQMVADTAAPLSWISGDLDVDGDVDADDIDILCANMGSDPTTYDVDEDGDVDEDDLTYLIENLVELQDGSGRVGTLVGDFNLDGLVNATDLAIMKATFGASGVGYAGGNANCDDVVNAMDLAILKGTFGLVAPTGGSAGLATGGVPEPATLSLLALGATGLAAKRRRRS